MSTHKLHTVGQGFRWFIVYLALIAIACIASAIFGSKAHAQTAPTLTFTAETTTGVESVVPKLTWSTTPAATSCTASGDLAWNGTKAASGSETLAAINASRTYTLKCDWPGDTTASLTWVKQLTYTSGAPLTIAKYTIAFGTSLTDVLLPTPPASVQKRDHNFPTSEAASVTGISTPGTYFFCLRALDAAGTPSDCGKRADDSSYPAKILSGSASATRSTAIAVNPKPSAATSVSVQ